MQERVRGRQEPRHALRARDVSALRNHGYANVRATPGIAFDLYRFPTLALARKFGRVSMNVTITFQNETGGARPAGCTPSR